MKTRKKPKIISVISLVLCLSLLTACGSNTSVLEPGKVDADDDIVIVDASIAQQQSSNMIQPRVSQPEDNRYVFDVGDQIQIVGWTGNWGDYNRPWSNPTDTWWNNAVSTYNGYRWETEPYMRWQNGEDLQHNFLAWYPQNFIGSDEDLTSVDVTVTGDSEKDDILVARWEGERPDDNELNLQFNHLMARFDVHLFFRNEYTDVDYDSISIETKLKNKVKCNLLTGEVDMRNASGDYVQMQARQHPDYNYHWSGTCITVPHEFNGELLTLKFIGNGEEKTINYEHTGQLNFRSGQRITLYLAVGKEKIELKNVFVTDWEIAPEINAGEAEEIQ